jgi:hypothetical protein
MCAFKEAFVGEKFCAVEDADGGQGRGWLLVVGVEEGRRGGCARGKDVRYAK